MSVKAPRKSRAHLTFVVGEHCEGEDSVCDRCGHETLLISPMQEWDVDGEPSRAGNQRDDDAPAGVQVYDEVTAHYCPECCRITSLSFNAAAQGMC